MHNKIYSRLEDTTKIAYRYASDLYQKKKRIIKNLTYTAIFLGTLNIALYNELKKPSIQPTNTKNIQEFQSLMHRRIKKLEDTLMTYGGVNIGRIKNDVKALQESGLDITISEMYFIPGIISGEAGMYIEYANSDSIHRMDAAGVSSDILNRYLSSKISEPLKKAFVGKKQPTFRNVAMKRAQYSTIIINPGRLKRVEKNFSKRTALTDSMPLLTTTRSYAAFIETLRAFLENPSLDLTEFSVAYKNDSVKSAAEKKWQGATLIEGYTMNIKTRIGEHDHYEVLDKFGYNPVKLLREGTAEKKRYNFNMSMILTKRKK